MWVVGSISSVWEEIQLALQGSTVVNSIVNIPRSSLKLLVILQAHAMYYLMLGR